MMLHLLTQMSKNNKPPIIIGLELGEKSTTKHGTKPFTNNFHVDLNGLEIWWIQIVVNIRVINLILKMKLRMRFYCSWKFQSSRLRMSIINETYLIENNKNAKNSAKAHKYPKSIKLLLWYPTLTKVEKKDYQC
jgi:hypothetical protein